MTGVARSQGPWHWKAAPQRQQVRECEAQRWSQHPAWAIAGVSVDACGENAAIAEAGRGGIVGLELDNPEYRHAARAAAASALRRRVATSL